eukprot:9973050-Lingulodinium_polyedra.AAC.1
MADNAGRTNYQNGIHEHNASDSQMHLRSPRNWVHCRSTPTLCPSLWPSQRLWAAWALAVTIPNRALR